MRAQQLTFEAAEPLVPSRHYAKAWAQTVPEFWMRYLTAYRARVQDVYHELAAQDDIAFPLVGPVEILAVASLAREWIFMRPATADHVTLLERWEDPLLARTDMQTRVDHERRVRHLLGVGDDFDLIHSCAFSQRLDVSDIPRLNGTELLGGMDAADSDAARALDMPRLRNLERRLRGRHIDDRALAESRAEFFEIRELVPRQRGLRFEALVTSLLAAHGCTVERGVARSGEQVDIFVHSPFRAIIECRWSSNRLQPRALNDLAAKLGRRPAIVAGIYISMSGFTEACRNSALHEPHARTILLWEERDIQKLLSGEIHVVDLFDASVSDLVRRYPADT
jgi:hypothetical protein